MLLLWLIIASIIIITIMIIITIIIDYYIKYSIIYVPQNPIPKGLYEGLGFRACIPRVRGPPAKDVHWRAGLGFRVYLYWVSFLWVSFIIPQKGMFWGHG